MSELCPLCGAKMSEHVVMHLFPTHNDELWTDLAEPPRVTCLCGKKFNYVSIGQKCLFSHWASGDCPDPRIKRWLVTRTLAGVQ